ncbi:MAG: hypothetical protein A3F11_07675 [Gammaproteobacteria bacterium RIFCSPHIGHO2_12_FULL_37_14]|nr:MAG: hypothetical protein A3F11_07675 [Gammaproteobacteria bacterium RIFCSPHIGHO2_12_FULL_37_14]
MHPNLITIEVAYAKPDQQPIIEVSVPADSTIEHAIQCSGILLLFPEIDLNQQAVGIFGKQMQLSDRVHEGDRVEIYRSLLFDPKELRRIRDKRHGTKR